MQPDVVAYYSKTAESYDSLHDHEHSEAVQLVLDRLELLGVESVLDTGCGTGRMLRAIRERLPRVDVRGNDPSEELLRIAAQSHGIPADKLDCAKSEALPYPDGAFDAVTAVGVLHHVPRPELVVGEMLRVARRAVFVSDANVYGQGSLTARLVKLALARAGMLRAANRLRRGGREWYSSDEDGIAWSYSVYDSKRMVEAACATVEILPTARETSFPLLRSSHCLLAGVKGIA